MEELHALHARSRHRTRSRQGRESSREAIPHLQDMNHLIVQPTCSKLVEHGGEDDDNAHLHAYLSARSRFQAGMALDSYCRLLEHVACTHNNQSQNSRYDGPSSPVASEHSPTLIISLRVGSRTNIVAGLSDVLFCTSRTHPGAATARSSDRSVWLHRGTLLHPV